MIDMHTHILPNIDDGSKSMEETINLIKEAYEVGFKAIISTSHYIEGYYEASILQRKQILTEVSKNLSNNDFNIDLYLGNEIYLSENMINLLEEKKASSINDSNYLLFEMPLNIKPLNLYNVIYEIIQYEKIPILAHPERYSFIQNDPTLLYDLIQKGVLMQANYASIIGRYGTKAQILVKNFLKSNMIHFLGSDVHRQKTIYPQIPQILVKLKDLIGEKKLEELTTINPNFVIQNKPIEIEKPQELKFSIKEKFILHMG